MATQQQRKAFHAARTEFKEMSLSELMEYEKLFLKFDTTKDGFLDFQELKYMMEKLNVAQTHLGLKAMIKEVDVDGDGKISYSEFLLIFRYAKEGKLRSDGLKSIASCVSVEKEGVGGAKGFFEQKAAALNDNPYEKDKAFFEEKKKAAQDKAASKRAFKDKAKMFE